MNKYIKYGFFLFLIFVIFLVLPVISGLDAKTLHGALLFRFRIFALIGVVSFFASICLNSYGLLTIDKNIQKGFLLGVSVLYFELFLIIINLVSFFTG